MTFSVAQHGEVGDLVADLLDRAARLGLDVAARLLQQLLALLARGLLERLSLGGLGRLAGAGDDLVGLRARLGEALAVLGEQLVGLARVRSAVSIDSSIARWRLSSASVMRGQASLRRSRRGAKNASSVQIISPMPG